MAANGPNSSMTFDFWVSVRVEVCAAIWGLERYEVVQSVHAPDQVGKKAVRGWSGLNGAKRRTARPKVFEEQPLLW